MIDDADEWVTALHAAWVRARSEHKCQECYRMIESGETYYRESVRFDGSVRTHKTCRHCYAVRLFVVSECGGFCYGGVQEDFSDHDLDSISLLRASIGMKHGWRYRRSGRLMPLLPFELLACTREATV